MQVINRRYQIDRVRRVSGPLTSRTAVSIRKLSSQNAVIGR